MLDGGESSFIEVYNVYGERLDITIKSILKENGMPSRFNTEENSELMYDMLTKKDYKKRYFLDSQKKGLF